MLGQIRDEQWLQLSDLIAGKMGLHFSPERREDLERGITGAALEFGFEDADECISSLLASPLTKAQLQVLASHLTVGETYFFRDKQALDALAKNILPELIHARRGHGQRLRIWSAACCSGEEAYSLAILVHQALPDLADWKITITASDINPHFLHKARKGIYSDWSFRNAPAWLKQKYFNPMADGRYAIIPEIKKMVVFAHLNLVEDAYPSLVTDTNAMDIIFCRNVLMYFTPAQIGNVIGKLHLSLVDGGWLAVSPSEASRALFPQFINVNFPGAIFFRKSENVIRNQSNLTQQSREPEPGKADSDPEKSHKNTLLSQALPVNKTSIAEMVDGLQSSAQSLYLQGLYSEVTDTLSAGFAKYPVERHLNSAVFSLMARALANQGRLDDALLWCDRWIAADKLDVAAHYLRGMVLMEQGKLEQAQSSLQRAVYLQPDFVLAHFSLGNLAHASGKMDEAGKHFTNALRLLKNQRPADVLPESEGLTAGRLIEYIASMNAMENTK